LLANPNAGCADSDDLGTRPANAGTTALRSVTIRIIISINIRIVILTKALGERRTKDLEERHINTSEESASE
jgi:hypothetical protein